MAIMLSSPPKRINRGSAILAALAGGSQSVFKLPAEVQPEFYHLTSFLGRSFENVYIQRQQYLIRLEIRSIADAERGPLKWLTCQGRLEAHPIRSSVLENHISEMLASRDTIPRTVPFSPYQGKRVSQYDVISFNKTSLHRL